MMHYIPGPRALAEFRAFTTRREQRPLFDQGAEVAAEIGEWQQEHSTPPRKSTSTAAVELVKYFHQRARGVSHYELPPGGKEATQAEDLIQTSGEKACRFLVDYGCRKAEQTHFSMRFFGALLQYVADGMAAFEERDHAAERKSLADQAEEGRKRRYQEWFDRGRAALANLTADERTALENHITTDFQARWAPRATTAENHFFKRMVESAMMTKLIGGGPDAIENPSTETTRLS